MRAVLLGVRFILELAMIAALAFWGFSLDADFPLRILAGVGAPVAAIAIWGRWVAPKSSHQLDDPPRFLMEVVLFALAALGLSLAGQPVLGVLLISVYLVDRLALVATGGTGV